MKKTIIVLFSLLVIGFSLFVIAGQPIWRGETISAKQTEEKWGKQPLNVGAFRSGSMKDRAQMASALLAQKEKYKGKFVTEIREVFGSPDGFYFSDVFPAYMIQRAKNHKEDSWQIVFLLDNERKVKDIVVHKNCCD